MFRTQAITLFVAVLAATPVAAAPDRFTAEIQPFLRKHCLACHEGADAMAGVQVELFRDVSSVTEHRKVWQKMLKMLRAGLMPPADDAPVPPRAETKKVVAWIDSELNNFDCEKVRRPGRVTFRRLNRAEYNNTIRDLVGIEFQPANDFPADDVGYGFDNIGDVLSLPTVLMEKYLDAAEAVAEKAIMALDPDGLHRRYEPNQLSGGRDDAGWRGLYSTGEVYVNHTFPSAGKYTVKIAAFGDQAGDEPARMEVRLDGRKVIVADVKATEQEPGMYEIVLTAPAGQHRLSAWFINDFYRPTDPDPNNRDRNLYVGPFDIVGPAGHRPAELPESHRRLIRTTPGPDKSAEQCAVESLEPFLRRAWRRPVQPHEVRELARLVKLAMDQGDSYERGVQLAVQAALVSPQFLFRLELDPPDGKERTLNEHELAARLSYFLWSSMPDDDLFRLAEQGLLRTRLNDQIRRMIASPKSAAFVENFTGQWLQLRNLETVSPDPKRFSSWNAELRDAMRKESELFFAAVLHDNRSIRDFLAADFTMLNERLAKHYGIDGVQGPQFRRVALKDARRGGVLGQASVLTVTSDPTRTSPVKRGKWVLENLLGTEPPPPPANVELLDENPEAELTGSLRQRFEQHRANPNCAVCHQQMDPLGFGLENYDAIGKWRDRDGKFPVDSAAVLPNGKKFSGPGELKAILRTNGDAFRRCLTEKMLTYALGRGLEFYDKCVVDEICEAVRRDDDRMVTLILSIVRSDAFQKRG